MRWIPSLKNSLATMVLCFVASANAQTIVDVSIYPGMSFVPPGPNARPSLVNGGVNLIWLSENENIGFFAGAHFLNRGPGGRFATIDQNGAFVKFVWQTLNFNYVHFPFGIWLSHQGFYINAGFSVDRFINYVEREDRAIISRVPPTSKENVLFGLHLEGGLRKELSQKMNLKLGIYLSNTFPKATGNPFVNFGATAGLNFLLNASDEEDLEEEY